MPTWLLIDALIVLLSLLATAAMWVIVRIEEARDR
jgi:hypothetical protein